MPKPSDEDVAQTVDEIMTRPWPLDPFLPVKRYKDAGQMPDFGILVKGKPNKVFKIGIGEALERTQHASQGTRDSGPTSIEIVTQIHNKPTPEKIVEALEGVEADSYKDIVELVRAGWWVD